MAGLRDPQRGRGLGREPHQGLQQPRRRRRAEPRGRRRATSSACSTPPARSRCRRTARSCTSCRRSSSSTTRTASRSRSAWPACASRPGCTSSPGPSARGRTSSSAATARGCTCEDVLGGPLAAAEAVLTPEERELGVALVDIGAGTTRRVVYHGGAIRHTAVLPVGGGHVTNDLAAALRTPFAEAEKLKQRYGSALAAHRVARPRPIEVPSVGGRAAAQALARALADIIEPRVRGDPHARAQRDRARGLSTGHAHVRRRADRRRRGARTA